MKKDSLNDNIYKLWWSMYLWHIKQKDNWNKKSVCITYKKLWKSMNKMQLYVYDDRRMIDIDTCQLLYL